MELKGLFLACFAIGCATAQTCDVWYGVDIQKEDIADNFLSCVWEPAVVKINAVSAACEAAAQILSVDETIKNAKAQDMPTAGMPGRGMGRPMRG